MWLVTIDSPIKPNKQPDRHSSITSQTRPIISNTASQQAIHPIQPKSTPTVMDGTLSPSSKTDKQIRE